MDADERVVDGNAAGGLLAAIEWTPDLLWFVPLLLLVIRPAAVLLGLLDTRTSPVQRALMCWFGIRGVGSIYYLMFSLGHGVPEELGHRLTSLTLAVVSVSIVVHGISVTPLMDWYSRKKKPDKPEKEVSRREQP